MPSLTFPVSPVSTSSIQTVLFPIKRLGGGLITAIAIGVLSTFSISFLLFRFYFSNSFNKRFVFFGKQNICKNDKEKIEGIILEIDKAIKNNQMKDAEQLILQGLKCDPKNTKILSLYGDMLIHQEEWHAGFQKYQDAVEIEPGNIKILIDYVYHLFNKSMYLRCVEVCEMIFDIEPGNIDILTKCAHSLRELKRYSEAQSKYEMALKYEEPIKTSDHPDLRLNYARIFFLQKQYAQSIQICETILKTHPDDVPTLIHIAENYIQLKELDLAKEKYEDVLSIREDISALDGLAYVFVQLGALNQAIQLWKKALLLIPVNSENSKLRSVLSSRSLKTSKAYMQLLRYKRMRDKRGILFFKVNILLSECQKKLENLLRESEGPNGNSATDTSIKLKEIYEELTQLNEKLLNSAHLIKKHELSEIQERFQKVSQLASKEGILLPESSTKSSMEDIRNEDSTNIDDLIFTATIFLIIKDVDSAKRKIEKALQIDPENKNLKDFIKEHFPTE